MRFTSGEDIKIFTEAERHIYLKTEIHGLDMYKEIVRTPEFVGDGGKITDIKVRISRLDDPTGVHLCIYIRDEAGDEEFIGSLYLGDLDTTNAQDVIVPINPGYDTVSGARYSLAISLRNNGCSNPPINSDWWLDHDTPDINGDPSAVVEIMEIPTAKIYDGEGLLVESLDKPSGFFEQRAIFTPSSIGSGAYSLVWDGKSGKTGIIPFIVGGWSDTIEDNKSALEDLALSVGTPDSGEGDIHSKLGAYSGSAGDDNNIKDDIAAFTSLSVQIKDIWSYLPDGSEGAETVSDLLSRTTNASEHNRDALEGPDGLGAIHGETSDILSRIGDPTPETLVDKLGAIFAELISTDHGLDILKDALDSISEDLGDPSSSGDTIESLLRTTVSEIQDSTHGLAILRTLLDTIEALGNGINSKLGNASDIDSSSIWGTINLSRQDIAANTAKLDLIIGEIQDSTHGLAILRTLLDNISSALGDTATNGTITEQVQSIKTLLTDAESGLARLRSVLDSVLDVLGNPTTGTIAGDVSENLSRINESILKIDAIQSDITAILDDIGDLEGSDIAARLGALSVDLNDVLVRMGSNPQGATLFDVIGSEYDGIKTEESGLLKPAHRVIDDLEIIRETLITAAYPGSGAYLTTDGGYYNNTEFIPNGTGPVVNEDGIPLLGVRVSAFKDENEDGIFETLVARAYTDGAGKWLMALDPGVYLLTFYKPGALLSYEWRVIDPDNSGLEPPDHAPTSGDLPGGALI